MAKLFITSNANNNNKKKLSVGITREKNPVTGKKQNHTFGIESP